MKKVLFFAMLCLFLASCNNGKREEAARTSEVKLQKGIFTSSETQSVDIAFSKGESPYFDVYMFNATENDHIIWFSFYKTDDVVDGTVRQGALPCRYYQVIIPVGERAKNWGYGEIVTTRKDGSEHTIKVRLVNQPQ